MPAASSINLKPYAPAIHPPSGGPMTETIIKMACEMPKTLPRFSSLECSAMNASKLGPTSERAIAPIATASKSHCHVSARISGIKPITPKTLPIAIARRRPSVSETQPPKICNNKYKINLYLKKIKTFNHSA